MKKHTFVVVAFAIAFLVGCSEGNDTYSHDGQGDTSFERRVNSVAFDKRVAVWSEQFDRSESWVRRHVSPNDSAASANRKLVEARLTD